MSALPIGKIPAGTARQQFRRPNYAYQPAEPPRQRAGHLSRSEKRYAAWLSCRLISAWQQSEADVPGVRPKALVEIAAISLVRSNKSRLDRLRAWGMLTTADADAVLERSSALDPARITRMLIWFTAEHLAEWQPSFQHLSIVTNKLLPFPYLRWLVNRYRQDKVTFPDILHLASHNPIDPDKAVINALDISKGLHKKYRARGISLSDAWYLTVHNPKDPEAAVMNRLKISGVLLKQFKPQGATPSNARRFAFNNPAGSEQDFQNILNKAKDIYQQYQNKGLTLNDALYFVFHNPRGTNKAVKKALRAKRILLEQYPAKDLSPSAAWRFAVHSPSNPEEALIKNDFRQPRESPKSRRQLRG